MVLLIMAICTVVFEKLYTILRWNKPRRQDITDFSFKMFKIMRPLMCSKCLKTTVGLTFTLQKANACSPWKWKYIFWVKLVENLKIISLSWNFVPRLIQICRIPWWCSLFLFSTGNTFLGKFGPKNQNCQFELKFRTN